MFISFRPGEFRGLRGPRGPEKKSAKSEVRGMNFYKVHEIRGPRNEFLQKSAKSEISQNNLKCLPCVLPQASLAVYVFTYGEGHQQWVLPNATILGCSFGFCRLAAYFGLSTTYSHISPMWPGTTPITSNTLQGSCRKLKAIYYAKPIRNYEITIARKIFFKLKDTSEHSLTM